MGRWYFAPEATREVTRHGQIAVLDVDVDWEYAKYDTLILGELGFRSILESELDARELPAAIVSQAARDALGAVAASRVQ
jgi:hypothetical protein